MLYSCGVARNIFRGSIVVVAYSRQANKSQQTTTGGNAEGIFPCRGGSRICQREADHGERYNGGLLPAEPLVGGQASLKLKAFCLFSYKKVKSLVFKLKKTPMFGPWRGGRPLFAHTWICQCSRAGAIRDFLRSAVSLASFFVRT